MKFRDNGDVYVEHPRGPWARFGASSTIVHRRLDIVKGTSGSFDDSQKRVLTAAYSAAKERFDLEAALDIVDRCISEPAVDRLVDQIIDILPSVGKPVFLVPHPPFDDDDAIGRQTPVRDRAKNAIPWAYASYLAEVLGGDVDHEIMQAARVGRTKLAKMMRFLCQPTFVGPVAADRPYILVDDTVTTGGTFAALRSFVHAAAGTVIATTALASSDGQDRQFEIVQHTYGMLREVYGDGFRSYWERTFGHGSECLTESEARALVDWALAEQAASRCRPGDETLHRLRARINQAAAKGE